MSFCYGSPSKLIYQGTRNDKIIASIIVLKFLRGNDRQMDSVESIFSLNDDIFSYCSLKGNVI